MKIKSFNRLKACVLAAGCFLLLPQANAGIAEGPAEGVEITEYGLTDLSPVAKVHAGRIFTDYEAHGFFRIGLLPMPVAENVKIQISSVERLTNALCALQEWHKASAGLRRLELRNVEISIFGETALRLRAARARVGNESTLELFDVSLPGQPGPPLTIAKGALQIAGNSAGRFSWHTADHAEDLFPLNLPQKTP